MRISILLPQNEEFNSIYGGAVARWTYFFLRNSRGSYDFDVFGFTRKEGSYDLSEFQKVPAYIASIENKLLHGTRFSGYLWCAFFLARSEVGIVHVQNTPHYVLILRKLGFKGKIILHLHNVKNGSHDFYSRILNECAVTLCCSQYIANFFREFATKPGKVKVLYNGITSLKSATEFKKIDYSDIRIIYIGRLIEQKGIHILIQAIDCLVAKKFPVRLEIIGGTEFRDPKKNTEYYVKLKEMAELVNKRAGSCVVALVGHIDHYKLAGYFKNADILCLPTQYSEAFGLVLLEAISQGVLAIGSDIGGIPEVIRNPRCLFDPTKDDLTKVLTEIIGGKLVEEMVSEQVKYLKDFSWETLEVRYQMLVEDVIQ